MKVLVFFFNYKSDRILKVNSLIITLLKVYSLYKRGNSNFSVILKLNKN